MAQITTWSLVNDVRVHRIRHSLTIPERIPTPSLQILFWPTAANGLIRHATRFHWRTVQTSFLLYANPVDRVHLYCMFTLHHSAFLRWAWLLISNFENVLSKYISAFNFLPQIFLFDESEIWNSRTLPGLASGLGGRLYPWYKLYHWVGVFVFQFVEKWRTRVAAYPFASTEWWFLPLCKCGLYACTPPLFQINLVPLPESLSVV